MIDVDELHRAAVRRAYTGIMTLLDGGLKKAGFTLRGARAALMLAVHEIDERLDAAEGNG